MSLRQVGGAKDSLPIDYAQDSIQVSFNAGYVQEFLDATSDAESITIQLKDATSAVEFRLLTEQPANYRYVVMPLRSSAEQPRRNAAAIRAGANYCWSPGVCNSSCLRQQTS